MDPKQQPGPSGPVMDVQRPRPTPAPSEVAAPLDSPMAPADSITSVTPDPGQVIGQPALSQTQPAATKTAAGPKKKRTGLIIGIVTTVIILLVAAGVGAFIWYTNNNQPEPTPAASQTESERLEVADIDATTAEIDKTLNTLNDSTDVTPGELSDQSIGL